MDLELRALQRSLQRAGRDVVVLDKSTATELAQQIEKLMSGDHFYVACCNFCQTSLYREKVEHRPTCAGVKLLKELAEATTQ